MLALVYLLFGMKHKLFVSVMSIVKHTQLKGNTSLIVESQHKKRDSELPTLPEVLYFTAGDALESKFRRFFGVINGNLRWEGEGAPAVRLINNWA